MNITYHTSPIMGPKLIILGSIHGDEPSGTIAGQNIRDDLKTGKVRLCKGSLSIITHCNQEAMNKGVRYVERNLNRCFALNNNGDLYEDRLANEIMLELDKHEYLLDLHSTSGISKPFIFCEENNIDLAKKIGVEYMISGWGKLNKTTIQGDTETYMNSQGKIGFTFESGNHNSSDGANNAYQASINFMIALGMIDGIIHPIGLNKQKIAYIEDVYLAKSNKWKFAIKDIANFHKISKGDLIGYDDTESIYSPINGYIIMPKGYSPEIGEEVFFYGTT